MQRAAIMVRSIQRFEVSMKGFIEHEGRALFVRESDTGYWELPGGRIDVGEEWLAHHDVLAREIREELGPEFRVEFGTEAATWTRQRPTDGVFLFILARFGRYAGGEPILSPEHDAYQWLDHEVARDLEFPPQSGYLTGIRDLWQLAAKS
jgi:8-oxo-dGTP diphosphatase